MKSLIPWKRNKTEVARTKNELEPFADFPFSMSRMRDEFDRLFDRLTREFSIDGLNGDGWKWGVEVDDQDDNVVVHAEAPGFDAGDFDVRVEDGRLVLRAAKKVEKQDEKGKVTEIREHECNESILLPTGIDKDKVDAKYRNGILTVTLPKTNAGKAKRIAVKAN